jgi:5'-3' exoribonuclease 1
MGIPKFWSWLNRNYYSNIKKLKNKETFDKHNIDIDNLMIDLNGVFHNSTQKIYKYGNFKENRSLLRKISTTNMDKQIEVFVDITKQIDEIFNIVKPKKSLILCIDGPAPVSKGFQQRSRRFRSIIEKKKDTNQTFDSNCVSPGTIFMDYLSKYIDWFIKKKLSEDDNWKHIEIIFSNEKVPGEGEAKILNYVRLYGNISESYCLHGLDADLIMLGLCSHFPNFYILRDDMYDNNNKFFIIHIGKLYSNLSENMRWEENDDKKTSFKTRNSINDFVFICFMIGNDFLPHVPSLEIIEGGIDVMIDIYKKVGKQYGHLTKCKKDNSVIFRKKSLQQFLFLVGENEKSMLDIKLSKKKEYFPDLILEKNSTYINNRYELDIKQYKSDYYSHNFNIQNFDIQKLSHEYIDGMQWVLSYYTKGVPHWKWFFPYHYAPFASDMCNYINSYKRKNYLPSSPSEPFFQLLSILPPESKSLLPIQFSTILNYSYSPLSKFFPSKFTIDTSGKKNDWEGIVLLPFLDFVLLDKEYSKIIKLLDEKDIKRNILGQTILYKHNPSNNFYLKSFYGDFFSFISTEIINL